jgi:hypothetical protein
MSLDVAVGANLSLEFREVPDLVGVWVTATAERRAWCQ